MFKLGCESGIRVIGDALPLKGIIYGIRVRFTKPEFCRSLLLELK